MATHSSSRPTPASTPSRPASTLDRPATSYSTSDFASTSYPNVYGVSATPHTNRPGTGRSSATGRRSRAGSVIGGGESQQIICAVSEGRGITPTVGMAFINITTGEAVLSQICDNQFYARTCHKLTVFEPSHILIVATAAPPTPSKMYHLIAENLGGVKIVPIDRRYWSERSGLEYIQNLAIVEDVEAIKVAIEGNYFATCCFSAALNYIDLSKSLTFAFHSLRIKYQAPEGSMIIDLPTIQSLELIQNLQNSKSKACLFGLMNQTLTPMGSRLLRSNILQPSTQREVLEHRWDAVAELTGNVDMFLQVRRALKPILDVEKLLTCLIVIPTKADIYLSEQSINHILMLKTFVQSVPSVHESLLGVRKEGLLANISDNCMPERIQTCLQLINEVINDDVTYQKTPLDLRNQRTYAVKAGVSGLLDVARQTFKEATEDVYQHVTDVNEKFDAHAEIKYDNSRRYYLRVSESHFDGRTLPDVLINRFRKKGFIECQTLDLVKFNQKIDDSLKEAVMMSDKTIQELLDNIRGEIPHLFKMCESIAMLDMMAAFCQLATDGDYVRPEVTEWLAIKSGRHPIREKAQADKFVPNDVYAAQQSRFQIITGCNMSGKSTYIRSIALMNVMAQVGSFVPASYASFKIVRQLFARVSIDDSIEANISTFASEMRETTFILRNIDKDSLVIIDELGRGTSTRDGLAIALSIAEALVESGAFIWFVTHFKELAKILKERPGVANYHLEVDLIDDKTVTMLYKIRKGFYDEKHYGLALARVVDLPVEVLKVAQEVSETIDEQNEAKRMTSKAAAIAQRRKLILGLKETLQQLYESPMDGKALLNYLKKVQDEFIARMVAIEKISAGGEDDSVAIGDESSVVENDDAAEEEITELGDLTQ